MVPNPGVLGDAEERCEMEHAECGSTGYALFPSAVTELLPQVCCALPLADLSAFGATCLSGRIATENMPEEAWLSHLSRHAGVILEPAGTRFPAALIRSSLCFWKRALPRLAPSDAWVFRNVQELLASQPMVEDAALLQEHLHADEPGAWRRLPWMKQCTANRLNFRFGEEDLAAMAACRKAVGAFAPGEWRSHLQFLDVRGALVPCQLRVVHAAPSAATIHEWSVSFEVLLSQSSFRMYSRGVQKALGVNFFSSTPHWRVCAPRCVSYMGSDGSVPILGSESCSRAAKADDQWRYLVHTGQVPAIGLVDVIEFMM